MTSLRVATANLQHGLAGDLSAAGHALADLGVDVVCLQEVDHDQPRTGHRDQVAEVAASMGAGTARFSPALWGSPDEQEWSSTPQPGPAYGVGLLSRRPVHAWHELALAPAAVRAPVPVPGRVLWLRDEPRVALAAVLDGLTVATTHLSFVPGWQVLQLRRVVAWLATLPQPVVLLGDLNLPGRLPALASGWTQLARVPTWPAGRPRVQLDHALTADPARVTASRARTERLPAGDHRALLLDLAAVP